MPLSVHADFILTPTGARVIAKKFHSIISL